jgi:hypothetical protein
VSFITREALSGSPDFSWRLKMTIQLLDTVINPEPIGLTANKGVFAGPELAREALAKRPGSLDGKTVYLIHIGYGCRDKFMVAVQRSFETPPSSEWRVE